MISLTRVHFIRPYIEKRANRVKCKCSGDDGKVRNIKKGEDGTNPFKKWIMNFFKIEEIDYDKFRKENKWAIRVNEKKHKVKK